METRSNQVLVGSIVLGIILCIAVFLVWLSGLSGGRTKQYDVFFKQSVDGLAKGSSVTFSGVPSGQIKDIALWKDNPEFVRVRIEVKDETPILEGTTATIAGVGFTGVSQVTLDGAIKGQPPITEPGPGGVPVIPTKRGGLGALLNSAPQLLERISTLTERLTELLSDKNQKSMTGILANVDRLSGSLADRGPEIASTIAETRIAVAQAGNAAEKIGNLAASVDGQAGPLIGDLRQATASAKHSMDTLDATLKDAQPGVQAFSKQTLPEIGQLVRDLRVMSESLTAVAGRLDQGGGDRADLESAPARLSAAWRPPMKPVVPLLMVALLAGCVSFGPKAPKSLLTLNATTTVVAGTSRIAASGETITVLTPVTPAAIATTRIPVYDGVSNLAYVRDAAWNEAPARLFQRLLSETVAQKTGRIVLDFRQATLDPGTRLSGQLLSFGVDAATMQAVVTYDGIVTRSKGGIETRRFEARVPVAAVEGRAVGAALNQAANDAAAQIAEWVK